MPSEPRTAFVSGPVQPTADYFTTHYVPRLDAAAAAGDSFVMGPAPGIDTLSLQHLLEALDYPASRITVFLTESERALYQARFHDFVAQKGGNLRIAGRTTGERDMAMTDASDYDILRYLTVDEARALYGAAWYPKVTATERNEVRRRNKEREKAGMGPEDVRDGEGRLLSEAEKGNRAKDAVKDALKELGLWDRYGRHLRDKANQ